MFCEPIYSCGPTNDETFAPALRHELEAAIDRIHQRAEMVTPMLAEILHRDYTVPRVE